MGNEHMHYAHSSFSSQWSKLYLFFFSLSLSLSRSLALFKQDVGYSWIFKVFKWSNGIQLPGIVTSVLNENS